MTQRRVPDGRSRAASPIRLWVDACFVTVLLALAPATLAAADLRGRVEGQNNFSANSFPLSGARVELMDSTGRQVIANAYTGPDGLYYFRRIAPGRYMLRVNGGIYPLTVDPRDYQDIAPIRIRR
jgi:hypothetical protein